MSLMGARIRIRPAREDDLSFLQRLWNDGAVMRYEGYPDGMHVSDADMARWWHTAGQAVQAHGGLAALPAPHAIVETLDGAPVGELTYSLDAQQRARLGIKLAPAACGHGYAVEALRVMLSELFATTPIHTVLAEPDPANTRAHRLLERCGFHPAPTENHPNRWECSREDFAGVSEK